MVGFKEGLSKGITKINVKTSNFMEENKLKTQISTQEAEIEKIKLALGEKVYKHWQIEDFTLENVREEVEAIKRKYEEIESLKKEIDLLYQKERQILGDMSSNHLSGEKIFCTQCGKESRKGYKFCEQCGNRLDG